MSTSSHPRGAKEGEKEASPSVGLYLGPALIERTAMAVEAEFRRHEVATALYLALVDELFAVTDGPSQNLSFLDGPSVSVNAGRADSPLGGRDAMTPATSFVPTAERSETPALSGVEDGAGVTPDSRLSDHSAVRANARGRAGVEESRPRPLYRS